MKWIILIGAIGAVISLLLSEMMRRRRHRAVRVEIRYMPFDLIRREVA